jgi:hypothetical protein
MQHYLSVRTCRPVFEKTRTVPIGQREGEPIATLKEKELAMNQMMNYSTEWMGAGMGMLPLVWVLTLALLVVLIRKNTKIRQRCRFPGEQGLRQRTEPERRTGS